MNILKWVKRIFIGLFSLVALLLLIGFIYEQTSQSSVSKNIQPTGEFVDIGGHQLHYLKQGSGSPTVVFESGLDLGGHLPWGKVQPAISKQTTTISYDRAGVLWSERGDNPKSVKAIGEELTALLEKANCPKPYILVGHSLAGITMRTFIQDQAKDIAGVILVDVSHPEQFQRLPEEIVAQTQLPPRWLLNLMRDTGLMRLTNQNTYPSTELADSMNIIANAFAYRSMQGAFDEMDNLEPLCKEGMEVTDFDSIAVAVITGTAEDRNNQLEDETLRKQMADIWNVLQKELLDLSPNSEHILAPQSGHYVQLDEPEVVIGAIVQMIGRKNHAEDEQD